MKKVGLLALIAVLVMTMTFVLVACDGAGGKGYDEITQISDSENVYVAKNKTGYNLINAKGKALLKKDYDEVEIKQDFLVYAIDYNDKTESYFDLSGKEFAFAVEGLSIFNVEVHFNEEKKGGNVNALVRKKTPVMIEVEYLSKKSAESFTSVYKRDGTLIATNTDMKNLDAVKTELKADMDISEVSAGKGEGEFFVATKTIMGFCMRETQRVKFDADKTGGSSDFTTRVRIYNADAKLLSDVTHKTDNIKLYDNKEYVGVECTVVESNGMATDYTVVPFNGGEIKVFDIYDSGDLADPTFEEIDNEIVAQRNVVVVSPKNMATENKPIEIYVPSTGKYLSIAGFEVLVDNNYAPDMTHILVASVNEADKSERITVYNGATLEVVMSNIKKMETVYDGYYAFDGILYNDRYKVLNDNAAEQYVSYESVVFDENSETLYYLAIKADGTQDYFKNSTKLKTYNATTELKFIGDGIIEVTDTDTNIVKCFNLFDMTIEYNNYDTVDVMVPGSGGKSELISIIKDWDSDGANKVIINILNRVFVYEAPQDTKFARITYDINDNDFVNLITIVYTNNDSNLYTVIDRVFVTEGMSSSPNNSVVMLHEYKTTSLYPVSNTTVDLDDAELVVYYQYDDMKNMQYSKEASKTTVYKIKPDYTKRHISMEKTAESDKNIVGVEGDYLVGTTPSNSAFNQVYNKSGKKLVNGEFKIEEIRGDLAIITTDDLNYGVIKFTADGYKVLEKTVNLGVKLIDNNHYVTANYDTTMTPKYTLKNINGKSLLKNVFNLKYDFDDKRDKVSVDGGMINLKVLYQTKRGGKYVCKSFGNVINYNYLSVNP